MSKNQFQESVDLTHIEKARSLHEVTPPLASFPYGDHGLGMSLMLLDLETYDQKIWRFKDKEPYTHRKRRVSVRNDTPFDIKDVQITADGHIEKMPELVGKPCFGIITAYLRHGSLDNVWHAGRKKEFASRCGRCLVQKACHFVCEARIEAVPEIRQRRNEWEAKGGISMFASGRRIRSGRSTWTPLVQAARTHPFTSTNDDGLAALWAIGAEALKAKDAERKRNERKRARAAGIVDRELVRAVVATRKERANLLNLARHVPGAPHWITKLADHSAELIASAWAARYLLKTRYKTVSAGKVAKFMAEHNWANGMAHDSLRARLVDDFKRIDALEKRPISVGGLVLWAPFDPNANVP